MKRGDVVTVAASGDYGKPRPAVIVQTDALPAGHASVVICQMTSECSDAPDFRVTIDPTQKDGLRVKSQVMADKPVTVRRERIGRQVGHLDDILNRYGGETCLRTASDAALDGQFRSLNAPRWPAEDHRQHRGAAGHCEDTVAPGACCAGAVSERAAA